MSFLLGQLQFGVDIYFFDKLFHFNVSFNDLRDVHLNLNDLFTNVSIWLILFQFLDVLLVLDDKAPYPCLRFRNLLEVGLKLDLQLGYFLCLSPTEVLVFLLFAHRFDGGGKSIASVFTLGCLYFCIKFFNLHL